MNNNKTNSNMRDFIIIGLSILGYILAVILSLYILSLGSISKIDRCMNKKLIYDIDRTYYICNEIYNN